MNFILIILCSILMGAFNFAFFCLGYYAKGKQQSSEGVKVTKDNAEFIAEMMNWRSYDGGN